MDQSLEVELIYEYNNHSNIPWNIPEYQPVYEYQGKKPTANYDTRYETKKPCYLDEQIKFIKDFPPPDKYQQKSSFDQTENKQYSHKVKINPRLKKHTYLDQIQLLGKKSKIGVGSYNIQKTQKQIAEENKNASKYTKSDHAPKPSFYEHFQSQATMGPGSGAYNPHLSVLHIKKERTTPENWRKKHKDQTKTFLKKKRKEPGPSSYRPVSAGTFDRFKVDVDKSKKKKSKSLNKGFGTDQKFVYNRAKKRVIVQQRPDPTKYNLSIPWKGKKDSTKKQGWSSFLSTRSNSISVYNHR